MAEHQFKDQYEYWDKEADRLLDIANGMNYQDFTKGDEYQDLSTRYTDNGNRAMENTLAQVSARTGGLASSYATRAANNSYNDYMRQLEEAAKSLYAQRLNEQQQAHQLARNNADDYYSRWMQEQQLEASRRYSGGGGGNGITAADLFEYLQNNNPFQTTGNVDRNMSGQTMGGGDTSNNTMDKVFGWTSTASQNTTGYSSWLQEAQRLIKTTPGDAGYYKAVAYINSLPATSGLKEELKNGLNEYYGNVTGLGTVPVKFDKDGKLISGKLITRF